MGISVSNLYYKVNEGDKKKTILNSIDYIFEESKITTISGPSGSGKTTLLYALAGLLNISDGKIIIMGKNICELSVEHRDEFRLDNIGVIFQNLNLLSFMNVKDNILLPYYLKKKKIDQTVLNKLNTYLELLGLNNIQDKSIASLSGGEQQRIAIIRAIISEPKIILCDEPTGNLDRENTIRFMDCILNINRLCKTTIVIVTHDELVNNYGENKIKIVDGQII